MSALSRGCLRLSAKLQNTVLARASPHAAAARFPTYHPTTTSRREYRGDSDEPEQTLSAEEEALLKIAQPKADQIFREHIALPTDDVETRRKRLIYRAKQRGWLGKSILIQVSEFCVVSSVHVLTFCLSDRS